MAEAAEAAPGCMGARMTGAGFGGACVAVVESGMISGFVDQLLHSYLATTTRVGEAMACSVVDGARILEEGNS